jgi:pimeloyl-ACP methyl ester carboxylesterase
LCAPRHFDADAPAVFFYTGNEADVELYVNATGLMWEMSAENGTRALLVFAEHRYYGQSRPSAMDDREAPKRERLAFLNAEQALADYAELLRHVASRDVPRIAREQRRRQRRSRVTRGGSRNDDAIGLANDENGAEKRRETRDEAFDPESVAVVAFGGSYGGMLATWFRAKYPHFVDGAVAGSAPIWSFTGETPPVDPNAFALGVSFDATAWGGVAGGVRRQRPRGVRGAALEDVLATRRRFGRRALASVRVVGADDGGRRRTDRVLAAGRVRLPGDGKLPLPRLVHPDGRRDVAGVSVPRGVREDCERAEPRFRTARRAGRASTCPG